MVRVFIGYDARETSAYNVLQYSIIRRSSVPVAITPIKLDQVKTVFNRAWNPLQSTEFSFSRFLTPLLCNYEGWAVFMDNDMIMLDDIAKLWAQRDERYAVQVVKHNHVPKEGTKFLDENGKRAGVTTTASGLQYEVVKAAEGKKPASTDTVTVHYRGTLLSGKEFDSSYSRNEPTSFPLNGVIPGWTEGLQLMNVGSKFKFFIPSKLAYAERGAGADIGPNSTLVFEVELLSIGEKQ
jgi:FKBP-type peptidyl-prolyl cis-trans isomerase